ncbi:MAG: alpha/beta fold hydrolase [Acidimicrobiales bacterium]
MLVHGCLIDGPTTWRCQRPLADDGLWRLVVASRRGYGSSPPSEGDDFLVDGQDVAGLLVEPAHLVGHSYGGLGALVAAGTALSKLRSLTLVEPPVYTAAAGDPAIDAAVRDFKAWWAEAPDDPVQWCTEWAERFGVSLRLPDPLPAAMETAIGLLRACRIPWTAEIAFERIADASFPKLVVSGGHSPLIETICDAVAERIGARRAVVTGSGHLVPWAGAAFNTVLTAALGG